MGTRFWVLWGRSGCGLEFILGGPDPKNRVPMQGGARFLENRPKTRQKTPQDAFSTHFRKNERHPRWEPDSGYSGCGLGLILGGPDPQRSSVPERLTPPFPSRAPRRGPRWKTKTKTKNEDEKQKRRRKKTPVKVALTRSWGRLGLILGGPDPQNRVPMQGGARFFENRRFRKNEASRGNLGPTWLNLSAQEEPKTTQDGAQKRAKERLKKSVFSFFFGKRHPCACPRAKKNMLEINKTSKF